MKAGVDRKRRWLRVRIAATGLVLAAFAVLVLYRAYDLQVRRSGELREMARAQHVRELRLAPMRGTIYDRHGAELAVSVQAESIWANPRALRRAGLSPESAARRLASVLSVDVETITKRLASRRYFVWIKRLVSPQQAEAVRRLELPGISMTWEARRYYPNRELAAHLLGFANVDGVGIEGLELSFEERLRGPSRRVKALLDRRGAVVFSEHLIDPHVTQGEDLVLTIDKTLQHIAERELDLAARTFEAKGGSVVVMEPYSGEILALANYPSFNPNEPGKYPPLHRRNRAISDRFEPGSTLKPFTIAGALAAGSLDLNQRIDCENGKMEVDEFIVHDSHPFSVLTPTEVMAYSSNIGTAKIGRALGRKGLFRALRRFGFGESTGLPLPGETAGILRHYRRWYEMDAVTIAFGQGMSATTVQLATALSALANGGRLMQPRIVRRIDDSRGRVREAFPPQLRRQVVSPAVAQQVSAMMKAVTGEGGTGQEAALEGFEVAGKTGTAQKADYARGGYALHRWLASFIGFVPADRPRLVIAVAVDEPMIAHAGGLVAGPVFRRVAEASLRHLGVEQVRSPESTLASHKPREASGKAQARTKKGKASEVVTGPGLMPDMRGMNARQALAALHRLGLRAQLQGNGLVRWQQPEPGSAAPAEGYVRLGLELPLPKRGELDEGERSASPLASATPASGRAAP